MSGIIKNSFKRFNIHSMRDFWKFAKQFVKFCIIGAVNTLWFYSCYTLLVFIGVHYTIAITIGWMTGILVSYFLNTTFVFKAKQPASSIVKTYVVYGISYLFTMGATALQIDVLGVSEYIAPLVVLLFTTPFNFFMLKLWALKKRKKIKSCVLFDLDGTILRTHVGVIRCINNTLKNNGYSELTQEQADRCIGPPIRQTFLQFFPFEDEQLEDIVKQYRAEYRENGFADCPPYDGMEQLLQLLRANGFSLAVATYKSEEVAQGIIKYYGLDGYFDVIVGSDHEGKRTKIDIMRIALDKLDKKADESYMVGDSLYDFEASKALNCDFIGVRYGYGFTDDTVPKKPCVGMFDTVENIKGYLKL